MAYFRIAFLMLQVYYSLRQPSKEFEINKNTGKLTVRSARSDVINLVKPDFTKPSFTLLDREQQDSYELAIVAEDGGDPPRRATTIIHIGVSDVNDHAPQFRYPIPHGPGSVLNVSCAQLGNQIIARVHANDSDSGQNGEIEYSIIRDISVNNRPKREPEPAIVKLRNNSDSGSQTSSKRDVKLSNDPGSQTSSKRDVKLSNDQSQSNETKDPNPSSPPPISSSSRSTANRRQFLSSPIQNTIPRGPTTDNFEINSYNGQIFLIHPIEDCSRPADVRLLIQAKDRGSPPQSSTALLTIHIHPTEQSDMYPMSAANGMDSNPHDRITPSDKVSDSNTWSNRQSGYERRFQRKSSVSNPDSSLHFLSGSSHWSAIVGLVVAMVILVLLLCLMLVILRRRFILEDQKVTIGKDGGMGRNCEKPGEISPIVRTMDGSRAGLYYKGSQGGHSMHEMKTGSPPQRSLSPTTLARLDDINCSSVTLELGPQAMLNTHYFCTMPPSTTHTTLNSGELGTVQREGRMQPGLRENPLGFSPPTQVIYRAANGDLYGYVEPQSQNNLTKGGHTYQTLQLNQRSKTLNPNTLTQPSHSTFRGTNDCFQRNILVENGPQVYNKTGHYTPLLGTANSSDMFRLLQASQPDLTEKRLATGSGSDDKLIQLVSDRAFSLTDLTPSKTDEMESEDQASAENGAEALRSFKQRNRTKSSQTKCTQQKPSSKTKSIGCANPSGGAQSRIYNIHSPNKTMAKSVTVNIEPRRGSSPLETYNAASFV
ncbi:hypothetical protein CSKR_114441 [Clonorchis sinensis]|uniref:Cadherin domain-containing protein n=1 Tax=Clonorchis sinensis TaxID=79923 RepID=A0A419Q5L1_CLOSI|nr:hypothetical protein CSKR_114441 [Clonorchis sinensis]